MNTIKKEWAAWLITLAPAIYLAITWDNIPDQVPLHYNFKGEADRMGSKAELAWLIPLVMIGLYGLLAVIPGIDPKFQLRNMGARYTQIKLAVLVMLSVIFVAIVHSVQPGVGAGFMSFLPVVMAVLLPLMGNYLQSVKPNYFIGFRTPWTLQNDAVWKKTHRFGGKLWFFAGLALIPALLLTPADTRWIVFLAVVILIALAPLVYSFVAFRNEQGFK